jgi:hypothetical protein
MKGILKWPLIIAAIVIVGRVVVEQSGAPDAVSNLVSVVALHFVLAPLYFAFRIGASDEPRPYWTQIKLVGLYVVLVRLMVLPTYWLARIYGWQQPRFFGLSGPDVSPFRGFIGVPVVTGVIWVVMSLVSGSVIGGIVITLMRKFVRPQSSSVAR